MYKSSSTKEKHIIIMLPLVINMLDCKCREFLAASMLKNVNWKNILWFGLFKYNVWYFFEAWVNENIKNPIVWLLWINISVALPGRDTNVVSIYLFIVNIKLPPALTQLSLRWIYCAGGSHLNYEMLLWEESMTSSPHEWDEESLKMPPPPKSFI